MPIIYHLIPRADWESRPPGPYRAASLDTEGFIHCSRREQVERIANLFYSAVPELLVLEVDAGILGTSWRDEDVQGESFPHVYGPIPEAAVLAVLPLSRGPDGAWRLRND